MGLTDTLGTDISTIFNATWNTRNGTVVPTTTDVALSNGAVKLDATILYADLRHSTELQRRFPNSMVAKIVRAYLSSMSKLVKHNDGAIRSFDGDRVMGVFVGGSKNTSAVKCALQMKYCVDNILKPKAEAKFPSLKEKGFVIGHCAGVATSEVLVVRGGVRGDNDLVFVGQAPNFAAKLSEIRTAPYVSWIMSSVYNTMHDKVKFTDGRAMWVAERRTLARESWSCYKSSWHWQP